MNLARSLFFARHIPARQIAARFWLEAKRRSPLKPRLASKASAAAHPPQPVFAPRTGMIERMPVGWRFTFVGRSVEMDAIDWHGDADQLWRMNLHYMEYLEEVDRDTGVALIQQWIDANPPFQRGCWRDSWNSYALSLRVVVWMQRLAAWDADPADPDIAPIVASLAQQLDFVLRNLETDIGGNHLIKNIKALAWGSAFFIGKLGKQCREKAIRLLLAEGPRQILADGMHYERSPSYHTQVFADLIETRVALADMGLDPVLAKMANWVAWMSHPDGGVAPFNDSGLTMAYRPGESLAAYERVTGRTAPTRDGVFGSRQAGYFGLHAPGFALIADCGKVGPDTLPAHAQGDIGSIELSIGGRRFIVDQGVFEYIAGDRRQASKSAHSHNCLAIHGAEPAEFYGAFRCGRRPVVTVTEFNGDDGTLHLLGSHDGYRNATVEREIHADADGIRIVDRVLAGSPPASTSRLLLHPECAVELDDETAIVRRGDVAIAIQGSRPWTVEPAVWWPDMGHQVETTRLCLTLPPGCFEASIEIGAVIPAETGQS